MAATPACAGDVDVLDPLGAEVLLVDLDLVVEADVVGMSILMVRSRNASIISLL
jgi:hypothetical protein